VGHPADPNCLVSYVISSALKELSSFTSSAGLQVVFWHHGVQAVHVSRSVATDVIPRASQLPHAFINSDRQAPPPHNSSHRH